MIIDRNMDPGINGARIIDGLAMNDHTGKCRPFASVETLFQAHRAVMFIGMEGLGPDSNNKNRCDTYITGVQLTRQEKTSTV